MIFALILVLIIILILILYLLIIRKERSSSILINPDPDLDLDTIQMTLPHLPQYLRLGRGDFVSLMGKTRPLVKSLGVLTYQNNDAGYGRYQPSPPPSLPC